MVDLSDYISAKEAAKIAGIQKSHVCRLCQDGAWEAHKIGTQWVIPRTCAERYQKKKPGLKKGQKINREKKKHEILSKKGI